MSSRYVPPVINPLTGLAIPQRDLELIAARQEIKRRQIEQRRELSEWRSRHARELSAARKGIEPTGPSVIPIDETPIPVPASSPDPIELGPDRHNALIARFWKER